MKYEFVIDFDELWTIKPVSLSLNYITKKRSKFELNKVSVVTFKLVSQCDSEFKCRWQLAIICYRSLEQKKKSKESTVSGNYHLSHNYKNNFRSEADGMW